MLVSANWIRARSTFTTLTPGRERGGSSRSMTRLCSVPKAVEAHARRRSRAVRARRRGRRGARRGRSRTRAGRTARGRGPRRSPARGRRPRARPCRSTRTVPVAPGRAGRDPLRDVTRLLDRHRREPGQRLPVRARRARPRRRSPRSPDVRAARSRSTSSRPPRSCAAPVASASTSANGAACTPAAQITVFAAIRSGAPSCSSATPSASIAVARAPSRTSTPSDASSRAAFADSFGLNAVSTRSPASSRITRVSAGSKRVNSPLRWWRASTASWPATSTPVGPPPITTNVRDARARLASSVARSASSKRREDLLAQRDGVRRAS